MARMILQEGRTAAGLVLPADAAKQVNDIADKTTLDRWVHGKAPGGNVQKEAASPAKAELASAPAPERSASVTEATAALEVAVTEPQNSTEESDAETTVDAETAAATPDNMVLMDGVGEAGEQKLYEAGYTTFEELAEADKAELAEAIDGLSEDSAHGLIKQAKKLAKKKAAGKL